MNIIFLSRPNRQFSGITPDKQGLGGTQSALIYLAQELALLNHEISIFCHCKEEKGKYKGVNYREVAELIFYTKTNAVDFFISVADENALKLGIKAKKILWWSHNDYSHLWDGSLPDILSDMAAGLATKSDKLLVVSEWHLKKLVGLFNIPVNHFHIFKNGVNIPYFTKQDIKREQFRLIYTSVPDRGLDVLLEIFPVIKKEISQAELHIFSGFDLWGKPEDWCHEMSGEILKKAEQEGIILHKTVNKEELAIELLKSTLFVYPNHSAPKTHFFAETSCIAALEAQAAGLPVITSNRGALNETVINNLTGILIDGDPYSDNYKNSFIKETVALLKDAEKRQKFSNAAKTRIFENYSWKMIAREWEEKLNEWLLSDSSTRLSTPPITSKFKPPQVTVIIPAYNREKNLKNTLNSLTYQTYDAFEVIVCDDGSTDNTKDLIPLFKDKLNIRYLYQEHKGFRAGHARNMGLKNARAKLIIFLDSDVVVPPTFMETHVKEHEAEGKYVVNSYVWRMTEYHKEDLGILPEEYVKLHKKWLKPDSRDRFELFERGEADEAYFLDSNALSVKMQDLRKVGDFDENFIGWGHEDTELGYRLGGMGYSVKFIKSGAESYHQYHEFSLTKEEERAQNWERLRKKYNIEKWYKPLWELEVIGKVEIETDEKFYSPHPDLLPQGEKEIRFKVIDNGEINEATTNKDYYLEGEFIMKIGFCLNPEKPLIKIKVSEGIVQEIRNRRCHTPNSRKFM